MKKVIFFLFLSASFCFGQLYSGYGFKVGISSSSQDWNYKENFKDIVDSNLIGLNLGLFVEGLKYKFFSSVFEVSYSQKGFNSNIMGTHLANFCIKQT